jgi:Na+/H+-translocating membrane pyrophosphatase
MGARGFDLDTVVIGLPAFITACIGAITALCFYLRVSSYPNVLETNGDPNREKMSKTIVLLQSSIKNGAKAFIFKEYTYLAIAVACLFVLVSVAVHWKTGLW